QRSGPGSDGRRAYQRDGLAWRPWPGGAHGAHRLDHQDRQRRGIGAGRAAQRPRGRREADRGMTIWRRLGQSPWLFAGPTIPAAVVSVWLPMAATLGLSFFDWSLLRQEATWRGLDHYRGTLGNPDFHLALVNNGLYLAGLLRLHVGVPLVLAFALVRVKAKATGRLYRTALFAP